MDSKPNPEHDDAGTSEARGASPTFRALLIGIDFYFPNLFPTGATYVSLHGCVNDVDRIEEMRRARITEPFEITKLVAPNVGGREPGGPKSAWPTYDNMKAALDGLLARAQPGDRVYIHYSGHGGRVPTMSHELHGVRGYDETLVSTDIGEASTRYLRDFDFAHYLDALTTKNRAIVTIALDICHSGGATRGVDIAKHRPRKADLATKAPPAHRRRAFSGSHRDSLRGQWSVHRRAQEPLRPAPLFCHPEPRRGPSHVQRSRVSD